MNVNCIQTNLNISNGKSIITKDKTTHWVLNGRYLYQTNTKL